MFVLLRSNLGCLLILGIGLQYEIADAFLRARIGNGTKQREAATFTIDRVLARRERDVAAVATATFPDGEPDQLQAVEYAVGEMQLGIREFAGRVAFVVRDDFHDHDLTS